MLLIVHLMVIKYMILFSEFYLKFLTIQNFNKLIYIGVIYYKLDQIKNFVKKYSCYYIS